MKQFFPFGIALLAAFLAVGCIQTGGQSGPSATPAGSPTAVPTVSVAATSAPAGANSPQDYASLVGSNSPYECDVKVTLEQGSADYKVKILGKNARLSGTVNLPTLGSSPVEAIVTETAFYSKITRGQVPNCDWMKVDLSGSTAAQTPVQNPADQLEKPNTEYSCRPASFGMEVFAEPSGACDLATLMGGLPQLPG